jgi:hypothetical protein
MARSLMFALSRDGTGANIWWSRHSLINGVFKGGGARGLAYAGALQAVEAQKLWFAGVAGASAGAIAAALIAAGLRPEDIARKASDGLASCGSGWVATASLAGCKDRYRVRREHVPQQETGRMASADDGGGIFLSGAKAHRVPGPVRTDPDRSVHRKDGSRDKDAGGLQPSACPMRP